MSSKKRSLTRVLLISIPLIIVLFLGGRYLVFRQIHSLIHERLTNLRKDGITIRYDEVRFNIWTGSFAVENLAASLGKDSTDQGIVINTPLLVVEGIQLVPFITSKTLTIDDIRIHDPLLSYRAKTKLPGKETNRSFLENIEIKNIRISNAMVFWKDSVGMDTTAILDLQLDIRDLGLRNNQDTLIWKDADLTARNIQLDFPNEYYGCTIKNIHLALNQGLFELDSLLIKPSLPKHAFMKKVNRQTDRIAGLVSTLSLKGFQLSNDTLLRLRAEKLFTNFYLDIFRDKRYPFYKDYFTKLPVHYVQQLPFQFEIDSFLVKDSYVSYEEYPDKGDSSGRVFFDKLNASITGLHNHIDRKPISLYTSAALMGAGDLRAHFIFPTDTTQPYRASGSLKNFQMTRVNDMLGAAAKVKIKSGTMHELKFDFRYNPYRSDGEVELNYADLKIISLRENKKHEQATSFIKTLLLNTFIIKKKMDEDLPDDKKTGTVLFYRDTKRSIFNYWWKSLLSGIKSAYDIDKLEAVAKKKAEKRAEKAKKKG